MLQIHATKETQLFNIYQHTNEYNLIIWLKIHRFYSPATQLLWVGTKYTIN